MDPSEIIRACLERGIFVSAEDVERLQGGANLEEFIASKAQRTGEPEHGQRSGRITHRVLKTELKRSVTPEDITAAAKGKYEAIKGMLLTKTSAVSISNAKDSRAPVALIGVVRRSAASSFMLEDMTGEIEARFESPFPVDDGDVVCARGPVAGGVMQCKEVLLPDVPLIRATGRMDARLLLTSGKSDEGCDVVISTAPIDTDTKNVVVGDSPSTINLYKDGGRVCVLFYKNTDGLAPQDVVSMLKRRCLRLPKPQVASCVIEPVPDILWVSGAGKSWTEIYKGIRIVHTCGGSAAIDLSSMETKLA